MEVLLLRHGIAEEKRAGSTDAERALTPEGKNKLRAVLAVAHRAGLKPDLILSSPLKRAAETAELARSILRVKPAIVESSSLTPESNVRAVWDEIRDHKEAASILLAGHNPLFSQLVGFLLGYEDLQVDFKKGALVRIDVQSFRPQPKGMLNWYLTPKLAEAQGALARKQ